jgi:hypothetical protein
MTVVEVPPKAWRLAALAWVMAARLAAQTPPHSSLGYQSPQQYRSSRLTAGVTG